MADLTAVEKGNDWLKKIGAKLELDKLILKESLNYLKPTAWRQASSVRPWCISGKSWLYRNGAHSGF
ncbi:hypothetical protein KIN_08970 [Litoreibacter roseus]|uniref:Uncharacterized protein n=1 Tax=Litoreibacter roseus TaxID=2601869 RepID=A0A6N6JBZ4_9RHOB|nr:hypothetical protein KIN_08970 [Litoreibacter roseus]